MAFSGDGQLLAYGNGGKVLLYDVGARRGRGAVSEMAQTYIASLAFAPNSQKLAVGYGFTGDFDRNQSVKILNVNTGKEQVALPAHRIRAAALAFAPDGKTLATGSWDGLIKLWKVR
jgi:WD40 repeat protein